VLTHLLNSPDLAPTDFHLFGSLKESRGEVKLENNDAVQPASVYTFKMVPTKISMQTSHGTLTAVHVIVNSNETVLKHYCGFCMFIVV